MTHLLVDKNCIVKTNNINKYNIEAATKVGKAA